MTSGDSEPPAEVYRRYLESGGLGFQRCAGCGAALFFPRVLYPVVGVAESGDVRCSPPQGLGAGVVDFPHD